MIDTYFGAHMSVAGGMQNAIKRGMELDCTAIQIFVKNNNRWRGRELRDKELKEFRTLHAEIGMKIIAHTSYLINLASPKDELFTKSINSMLDELSRCERLGIAKLILHPGAHTGSGEEAGLKRVAVGIDKIYSAGDFDTKITLEVTSGGGSKLGYKFEHLAEIIERSSYPEMIEICYDTCHAFAAGYDIRTEAGYKDTFDEFERVIGMNKLAALHLNDSKGGLGSNKDRHEHIGRGYLGLKPFELIMNDERFVKLPKVLETPKGDDYEWDRKNLATLRRLIKTTDG